jgi:biopolymer transport protein ExbB
MGVKFSKLLKTCWALIALAVCVPTAASADWWQTDWSFRKQITIDTSPKGANISEALGRVPLLVRLHSGNFSFSDAADNGIDIRFVAADNKTPLAYHIERFDPVLGVALVWVDIPDFPAAATKDIWLYYGNKKAPAAGDAAQTFDANYSLVYHFDDAAGSAPKDRTAYGNNAQNAPSGIDDAAIIGKGAKFAGAAAVMVPASPSLATTDGGEQTISLWAKPGAPQPGVALYARRNGADALIIGLDNNVPYVEVDKGGQTQKTPAAQGLAPGQWSHVALVANATGTSLYVGGTKVAQGTATIPALNTPTAIGGDVTGGPLKGFVGEMDELRISRIARTAGLFRADAMAQGGNPKIVAFGVDEKQSGFGFGYFGIIVQHVTIDAWVVIIILLVMALVSFWVMWVKSVYVGTTARANNAFMTIYRRHGGNIAQLRADSPDIRARARLLARSSIYRIYRSGADEIERRMQGADDHPELDGAAIEVIRAIMDTSVVRENQRLSNLLVLLTIAISGGPFLGLLGTVVGVMITFAAIAAAGDVNINAIAPGISAALLATVTGLFVAIPALFGYNYLVTRNKSVSANMQVFVDEFVTRASELYRAQSHARLH